MEENFGPRGVALRAMLAVLLVACNCGLFAAGPEEKAVDPGKSLPRDVAALVGAIEINHGFAATALAEGDFATFEQTLRGMQLVVDALSRHSDELTWTTACRQFQDQIARARQATKARDRELGAAALETMRASQAKWVEIFPDHPPIFRSGKPVLGLGPMMVLIDATLADAKTALAVGNEAKYDTSIRALAALGPLLEQYRRDPRGGDDDWTKMSREMSTAALGSTFEVAAGVKARKSLLRQVGQSCENCHQQTR